MQPKYSGESHFNGRILMKDKWSYWALLKGLGETRGAWLLLQQRALNRITGRGWKIPLSFTPLCSQFFKLSICLCPLFFSVFLSSSLSFPTSCHYYIYHLFWPVLILLHSLFPWFGFMSILFVFLPHIGLSTCLLSTILQTCSSWVK